MRPGRLEGRCTRPDAVINGNWTAVTDQVVTLGLPDHVINVIPLQGIRFDEATGEGPADIFSDFLDFLLDAATFVVQGLVLIGAAIADFFVQAAAFLVELGMAVIGAIKSFLGQVAEAVERVGEALAELANFVVEFASSQIGALFGSAFAEISAAVNSFVTSLDSALEAAFDTFSETGSLDDTQIQTIDAIINGPLFAILTGIGIVLLTLLTILTPYTVSLGFLLALLTPLVVLLVWQSLLGQSGDAPAEQSGVTGFVPLGEVGADALGSAFSSLMATLLGLSPQGVGQSSAPMLVPQDQSGDCTVAIGLASFFIGRSGLFIFATLAGNFDKTRMTAADIAVTMAVFSLIVGVFAILGGIAGLTATVFAALLGFVSVYYSLLALRGFPSAAFLGRISTALALGGIFISMIGLTAC